MEAKLHLLSRKSRLLNFNRWIKHICFIKIKNNKLYKMSYVLDKSVVINCSWIGKDRSFFHGYINMFHYFFCLSPSVRMGTLQKVSKVYFRSCTTCCSYKKILVNPSMDDFSTKLRASLLLPASNVDNCTIVAHWVGPLLY
jgi:hypothetical protein